MFREFWGYISERAEVTVKGLTATTIALGTPLAVTSVQDQIEWWLKITSLIVGIFIALWTWRRAAKTPERATSETTKLADSDEESST